MQKTLARSSGNHQNGMTDLFHIEYFKNSADIFANYIYIPYV